MKNERGDGTFEHSNLYANKIHVALIGLCYVICSFASAVDNNDVLAIHSVMCILHK